MNHIKLIKSQQDHQLALERLMELMDMAQPSSAEIDEIDVLALLIEKYEDLAFPIDSPDPIEAIKFRMEQGGLKNKDLVKYVGSAPKVTEILNGTRNLSLNMIRKLSKGLGISADVLIQAPAQKAVLEKAIEWRKFPLSEMRKRGYFEGFSGSLQELKEYAEEKLSGFLGSVDSGFNLQPAMLRSSAHLRSNHKEVDLYALWAWQVRVLKKAAAQKLPEYKANSIDLECMKKIASLSWLDQGPSLAIEFLNKLGVHVIIEPHLPKTYLDGAVCRGSDGNPVVALTLRHDRIDSFWFSLMHELAHIALHLDENETWYLDDLEATGGDEFEQQADSMAQEALIPSDVWDNCNLTTSDEIRELANKLEISPCIIAGRLRHDSAEHAMFGRSFREKISSYFF